jgi:hypothetical protein
MSAKAYPLVVKRVFFEQFASGEKTVEYRRHSGQFTERTFWPGREISIRYRYDHTSPRLTARVTRFEVARLETLAGELATVLKKIYPALAEGAEIALIHLRLE